jgi:tetratricopeptide (TPR) repeat protein
MNAHHALSRALVLALLLSLQATTLVAGKEVPEPATAIHMLAPPMGRLWRHDPLMLEAGIRLAGADLAARSGVYARYWPLEQLDDFPQDAYPKVEVAYNKPHPESYIRLRREGNTFISLVSQDGQQYREVDRHTVDLPHRTLVGLMIWNSRFKVPVEAELTDARLNGEAFVDYRRADIGELPSTDYGAHQKGDCFLLRAVGYYVNRDERERGPFLYKVCEGDFEIDARFARWTGKAKGFASVMCRASTDLNSPTVVTLTRGNGGNAGVRQEPFREIQQTWDATCCLAALTISRGPEEKRSVTIPASVRTWDELVRAVEKIAEAIEVEAAPHRQLRKAQPASPQQLALLNRARAMATEMHPGKILAASRGVDRVLNENPLSPEAHYTAALCGALLACQDLSGRMQPQGRFLAGPLAHLLLARRLAPPGRPEDALASAWVFLACGYPNQARATLDGLDPDSQASPEARALRLFITCDYRMLTEMQVMAATPLEQLAWVRACERCGNNGALEDLPTQLARENRTWVFLPISGSPSVGSGHANTALAPALAFARDASDLLGCEDLPETQRRKAAGRMARALGLDDDQDLPALTRAIPWAAVRGGINDDLFGPIGALMDLYAEGLRQPLGPVPDGEGFCWNSMGVHGHAWTQRGLLLQAMFYRAKFLGRSLGAPQATNDFCRAVAQAVQALPGAPEFFLSYAQLILWDEQAGLKLLDDMKKTPFGQTLTVRAVIYTGFPGDAIDYKPLGTWAGEGRGSWQWTLLADANSELHRLSEAVNHVWMALTVDDYAFDEFGNVTWAARDISPAQPLLDRMPHNSALQRRMGWHAQLFRRLDQAEAVYRKALELEPADTSSYQHLYGVLIDAGRPEEAITLGEQAVRNCAFSVGLSNLMGRMACQLVEMGRTKEALAYGEQASQSYSASGLRGLAVALEADGQHGAAKTVFRDIACRYHSGCGEYVKFLVEHQTDAAVVMAEIQLLLTEHPQMRKQLPNDIVPGFMNAGEVEMLRKALDGPLSYVPERDREHYMLLAGLYARDYGLAMEHARKLEAMEAITTPQIVFGIVAAWLDENRAYEQHLRERLRSADPGDLSTPVKYLLGEITLEEMDAGSRSYLHRAYAEWIMGVQCERQSNLRAALEHYRVSARQAKNTHARWIPKRWIRVLTEVQP